MNATSLWKKHRHRVGLGYFLAGVAVGVIISFFMGLPWRYSLPGGIASATNLSHNAVSSSSCTPSSLQGNGWNPVHVFYGDTNQIQYHSSISNDYFHQVSWYSQARQDEVVAALLRHKRGGYFVDLAANDPVKISNTYALETRLGWTGLCLEPNPTYWTGLAHRSKCHVIGAVVGARRMQQVKFRFPNKKAPKGGIVGEDFDNKVEVTANNAEDVRPRYTVSLSEILERFQAPALIDYLSLDVEGAEDLVMEGFPFDKYRITIITLERPSDALSKVLTRNGYQYLRLLKVNSGDTLWVHESMVDQLDIKASCKIDTMKKYLERPTARHTVVIEKDDYCVKD